MKPIFTQIEQASEFGTIQVQCSANQDDVDTESVEPLESLIDRSKILNDNRSTLNEYALCLAKNFPSPLNINDSKHKPYYFNGAGGMKPKMLEVINAIEARASWGTPGYKKGLKALSSKHPDLDIGMVMALAHRESSTSVISSSNKLKNSYNNGGLDFIGSHYSELKEKYLPEGYGDKWEIDTVDRPNEHGYRGKRANIPQKEMVVAYGAYLKMTQDKMYQKMKDNGFSQEDIDSLTPEAKRFWTVLFFAGPGGKSYDAIKTDMNPMYMGGLTALSLIKKKKGTDANVSLNSLDQLGELNTFYRTRIAMATAGNATLLSDVYKLSTQSASGEDCTLP